MPDTPTVDDAKTYLRELKTQGSTRYGGFGERLYEYVARREGQTVVAQHHTDTDFLVNGVRRVDVKCQLRLEPGDRLTPQQVPGVAGVTYAYVMVCDEMIRVHDPELGRIDLSWPEALPIYAAWRAKDPVSSRGGGDGRLWLNAERKRRREWFESEWGLRTMVVIRRSRQAQRAMALGKWGPEAFHQRPDRKWDLVVLLFFDKGQIYEVFAYPFPERDMIAWTDKAVGSNPGGRLTFDPAELNKRYKFPSWQAFESEFAERFGFARRV